MNLRRHIQRHGVAAQPTRAELEEQLRNARLQLAAVYQLALVIPAATDAERLSRVCGYMTGKISARAVPTLNPSELKLEFFETPHHKEPAIVQAFDAREPASFDDSGDGGAA